MKDDLLQYYDYIRRLSESKCSSKEDAEDLISDTFLAAYSYLYRGGKIEFPKTWLANTLMHKYNSMLRKKYNKPVIVDYDTLDMIASDEDEYESTEEASIVRKEILYLSKTTREVLIRFYYNGYSVSKIASQLNISEGTVKSRLSAGRDKIKKGLTDMAEKKNNIPGNLNVSWSGSLGPKNEPICLTENDLIAQNLLILAYEKPLSMTELADAIGIPTVYIEPIVEKLTNGELMVKTTGGKYYTDFIIYKKNDELDRFDAQLKFVDERFDRFWRIVSDTIAKIDSLEFCKALNVRQLRKLERYAALRMLQNFQIVLSGYQNKIRPKRRDGGKWIALGWHTPSGYYDERERIATEYTIRGGHRTNGGICDYNGAKFLQLCEFDTTLWDNPARFWLCEFDTYFKEINKLLWCIYKKIPIESAGISNTMIESIDKLISSAGLLTRENGDLCVDIPVMTREVYSEIGKIVNDGFDRLSIELGEEYKAFLKDKILKVPKHLTEIEENYKYLPATQYIVMAVIRKAYDKGLHLSDVDYCCPPVVLVYEE